MQQSSIRQLIHLLQSLLGSPTNDLQSWSSGTFQDVSSEIPRCNSGSKRFQEHVTFRRGRKARLPQNFATTETLNVSLMKLISLLTNRPHDILAMQTSIHQQPIILHPHRATNDSHTIPATMNHPATHEANPHQPYNPNSNPF